MTNAQDVLDATMAKSAAYAAITVQLERLTDDTYATGQADSFCLDTGPNPLSTNDASAKALATQALVQSLAQLVYLDAPRCHHAEPDGAP